MGANIRAGTAIAGRPSQPGAASPSAQCSHIWVRSIILKISKESIQKSSFGKPLHQTTNSLLVQKHQLTLNGLDGPRAVWFPEAKPREIKSALVPSSPISVQCSAAIQGGNIWLLFVHFLFLHFLPLLFVHFLFLHFLPLLLVSISTLQQLVLLR